MKRGQPGARLEIESIAGIQKIVLFPGMLRLNASNARSKARLTRDLPGRLLTISRNCIFYLIGILRITVVPSPGDDAISRRPFN